MLKLLKWTLISAAGFGAVGYFLFGDNVMNYVGTMASSIKEGVRGQIPIEFELKRAEKLIRDIGPQIHQCKVEVARAEVRLENLIGEVEHLEGDVSRAERKLKAGAEVLASSDGRVSYQLAGATYSRERVQVDLERTFESYKTHSALLQSKKALIQREERAVGAARGKLVAVQAEESRLKDLVGQLLTQKAQIDAMKASSKHFELDDSALGEAKRVLAEVKERLDVAQKVLADDLSIADDMTSASQPDRDIVKEIRDHFAAHGDPGVLAATDEPNAVLAR